MTLQQLRVEIQEEAGVKGLYKKVGLIDSTINSELRAVTSQFKFPELLLLNHPLTVTNAGDSSVTVPTDMQHFDEDSVRYSPSASLDDVTYLRRKDFGGNPSGTPIYYQRAGLILKLFPYEDTLASSKVYFNYYKHPAKMFSNTAFFADYVTNLVKLNVLARLVRTTNAKLALLYKQDAVQAKTELRSLNF